MHDLTANQKMMLEAWQQHTYAEFGLKDADAALAVMTENPYVLLIPAGTGGVGRTEVYRFYAEQMLPNLPPDLELVSLSQTFGDDRIVEEFVIRFTHTLEMDWVLPGVSATGRKVDFALVGVIGFQGGKVASEHLYWDQATVLYQLGILDHPVAAAGPWRRGATSQAVVSISGHIKKRASYIMLQQSDIIPGMATDRPYVSFHQLQTWPYLG